MRGHAGCLRAPGTSCWPAWRRPRCRTRWHRDKQQKLCIPGKPLLWHPECQRPVKGEPWTVVVSGRQGSDSWQHLPLWRRPCCGALRRWLCRAARGDQGAHHVRLHRPEERRGGGGTIDYGVNCTSPAVLIHRRQSRSRPGRTADIEANGHSVTFDGGNKVRLFQVTGGNLTIGGDLAEQRCGRRRRAGRAGGTGADRDAAATAGSTGVNGTNGTVPGPGGRAGPGGRRGRGCHRRQGGNRGKERHPRQGRGAADHLGHGDADRRQTHQRHRDGGHRRRWRQRRERR